MKFLEGIEPRAYQQAIFETCLKKNCLVVLPTGIGKTLIALMLTIQRMQDHPGERVVFLAPTKPLAEQHMNTFEKHLPALFGDMQLFTGKVKAEQRKKIWETADIIFSTPQCVANDVENRLYDLSNVCLLIEDEAHRCFRNYSYNYVAQQYQKQAQHPRILGLTASPGNDVSKIKEICKNLFIEDVELRTRESLDVKEYLQELEFKKVEVDFPPEFEEIRQILQKIFEEYIDDLKRRRVLYGYASKTNLINLQKKLMTNPRKDFNLMWASSSCAQAIKMQHAIELLETQNIIIFNKYLKNLFEQAAQKKSKGVINLVKRPEFNFAYTRSNELIAKNFDHPKLKKLIEIVEIEQSKNKNLKIIVFTQFRESANIISEKLKKINGIKTSVFVGQAKKEGLGLSQQEQKKMLQDFSAGKTNVLCATSIAEEGLDIPEVNSVIFYEPVPSAIRAIQRAGRTARLIKGKLFILVTKKTRDEAHYYISRSREKQMHSAIDKIKKGFSNSKQDFQKTLK